MLARFERVMARILADLSGDHSLDELATTACMSRFHFHRMWTAHFGESPTGTVKRLRLNAAAPLVALTDRRLPEIAAMAGYRDVDAFSRSFRVAFGQPPEFWRTLRIVPKPTLPHKKGMDDMHDVQIKEIGQVSAAALLHLGPYARLPETFSKLRQLLEKSGAMAGAQGEICVYYDSPGSVPEAQQRAHAAIALGPEATIPRGADTLRLPAGRYAVLRHVGAYSGISSAWDWLYGHWLPESGEDPEPQPAYEIYLTPPSSGVPVAQQVMEIRLPLRRYG